MINKVGVVCMCMCCYGIAGHYHTMVTALGGRYRGVYNDTCTHVLYQVHYSAGGVACKGVWSLG